MNRNYRWRELGSNRIITVLLINLVSVFVFAGLGIWIVNFQLRHHIIRSIEPAYQIRAILLSLLLNAILLAILDYQMIVRPINAMEDQLQDYIDTAREAENQVILDDLHRLTLRTVLTRLISQEQAVVQRNRSMAEKQLSTELYAMQSRINPHFLYNTLDSIRGLAYLHNVDEIAELTEALSKLFRNMISSEGKLLTLRQEIENIDNYVKIQLFRFNHKFEYQCDVDPQIMQRYKILNMTLQPIVENSIMHGLERKVGMGYVRISAYVTERRLVISVSDNGAGIPEEKVRELNESFNMGANAAIAGSGQRHSGIGLKTINRRIKLQFGDKYGLSISSTPGINTTTEIVLPQIANVN